jgi:hypothetical protein
MKTKIGEEFGPAPQFKTLYFLQFSLILLIGIVPWAVPVMIFAPIFITMLLLLFVSPLILLSIVWIPLYW